MSVCVASLCDLEIFYLFTAKPNRDHVFHINFPETWTQHDLNNYFKKYGPVSTRWINNRSAFVLLIHRENAPILLKTIDTIKDVKVSAFSTYSSANSIDIENVSCCCCIMNCHFVILMHECVK